MSRPPARRIRDEIDIPDVVIRRLPLYARSLQAITERDGPATVSSEELAEAVGISSAQIRSDLAWFGRFGTQGHGYEPPRLIEAINHILGLDRTWNVALVGYGNLGRAIAQYRGFVPSSFRITAVFDRNEERIGTRNGDITIEPLSAIASSVQAQEIRIGIIAVPMEGAQAVADALVAGGVEAILNYAPIHVRTPPEVTVRDLDPVGAMQSMTYYLTSRDDESGLNASDDVVTPTQSSPAAST
ncbi:MAG TPA: redox-sensing transcriptional repressor Rex [Thermomicrobiales bacterium]|nr:redox-sensing transcriptional repressor Rex [Thermomicrobiales bacterium]HRA46857.1 redox-sensing transcriptional repressor Rex [Thermomicrobiales bacterium]